MIKEINLVSILVLAVLIFYALRGYKDGFIRTLFGMFAFLLAVCVSSVIGPQLSKAVRSNEKLVPFVTQRVDEKGPELPEILINALTDQDGAEDFKELATKKAQEYIQAQLANWIINSLSFIVVFIAAFVLLWYLCSTLNIISKLPIINGINKTAGLLVGVLRGLITIWMWCIVLMIFAATGPGRLIFSYINQSGFLGWIYNHNLLFEIGKIFYS